MASNDEAIKDLHEAWDLLLSQARIIAMLPIEDWLAALDRAETMAPILDPTLYRDYLYSEKGDVLKSIFRPALALKRAVLAAQQHSAVVRERNTPATSTEPPR